nr:ribonuclease H-like domain-containing protein [Tanacetum cinerariifolium]
DAQNVLIESEDMNYDSEQIDQNEEDANLAEKRELLASLIAKLKCEINESKNRNTLLETSNKVLVEKLKSEIADFKNKNKSLTEANNKLSEVNDHLFADLMKSKAELKRRNSVEYASEMELECAKVRGDLLSYKWNMKGNPTTATEKVFETYKNVKQEIRDQLNAEAEAVQIILTGIDNDIYSTVDACPNACKMWKAIERLKQGESINVQDLKTNLFWEFGKFTSLDGETLKSYYSRAEKIARVANPLALVAQQQQVYHPQTHPTHYNQHSSTRTHQSATRNRGKALINSPQPIYDQDPSMKIYKPTNNNLRTSSNTSRANQDNSPRIHRNAGYEGQRSGTVAGTRETVGSSMVQKSRIQCYNCKEYGHVARECQKPKRAKDAAYYREKMLLCKQEEAGIQLNAEQADWKDDTDHEFDDQELEAHYMYMAKIQEVSPYAVDSGPIFDKEPEQKVQNDDHYDVFAIECQHPEQSESIHNTYLIEQDAQNVSIELVDMNYDIEQIDENDEDVDLAKE